MADSALAQGTDPANAYPAELYRWDGAAIGVDGFAGVDAQAIAGFHENGFLVIRNAFEAGLVDGALAGLLRLLSGAEPSFEGVQYEPAIDAAAVAKLSAEQRQDYVRKFMGFVQHEPRLLALAVHCELLDVVQRIIGEAPVLFQDMALLKPPRIGSEKPWHQDQAYFDLPLDAGVVGVWIALDAATTDNGCMVVVPGSHQRGPIVHFQRRDWQICDTDVDNRGALAVPLQPGGCLLFSSLMHHGTPANRGGKRRRAIQYHYRRTSAAQTSREQRLAVFGAEGKKVSC